MPPPVALGMPVYNAERYLEAALDSLLSQTFNDFELIISDNGSTDGTGEICRRYASTDERIRYSRNEKNIGLVANFNRVFELSRSRYFKWCAADDLCAPDYLRQAVEILDSDPSTVLVFSLTAGIDEDGKPAHLPGQVSDHDTEGTVSSADPVERFQKLLRNMWWVDGPFYGVMRADALAQTPGHRYHVSGDQLLIAEMCFLGRFVEIPEVLFFSRYHTNKTSAQQKNLRQRTELIENRKLDRPVSRWWRMARDHPERILLYVRFVRGAGLSFTQRLRCYAGIARNLVWWGRLRLYQRLARWHDFRWLRPDYPPD